MTFFKETFGIRKVQRKENSEDDGDKWQSPFKVYHRSKGSKAQALIWHSLNDKGPSGDLT